MTYVGHLASFVQEVDFCPWEMVPDHSVVSASADGLVTLAMCTPDRGVCAVLVYAEHASAAREVTLALPRAPAMVFWLDPATGERTAAKAVEADGGYRWQVPPAIGQAVLYCSAQASQ